MIWQHVIRALSVYCPGNENVCLWLYTETWHEEHLFDWKKMIRDKVSEVKTRMCIKYYLWIYVYLWAAIFFINARLWLNFLVDVVSVWQRFIVTSISCGCVSPPVIITHLLISLPSLNINHFVSSAQTIKNPASQCIITSFVWKITVSVAIRCNCMQEQSCSLCK